MNRSLKMRVEQWPLGQAFRVADKTHTDIKVLLVEIVQDGHVGRGEAVGVRYLNDSIVPMQQQVDQVRPAIEAGADKEALQTLLPPGGARNAVDCALWDLDCKLRGKSIWQLTGMTPKPVTTMYTIGIEDQPAAMADKARSAAGHDHLKIKLDAHRPLEKLSAIRAARPDARLVIDANQGLTADDLVILLPKLAALNVAMVEQPLPRGDDSALDAINSPLTLCADESCLNLSELDAAARRYDMINIKLDKTGGLTEALALARMARAQGLKLMVGNMLGTSLAMAPGYVLAQLCDLVDLDGPLLLQADRPGGLSYEGGQIRWPDRALWGDASPA